MKAILLIMGIFLVGCEKPVPTGVGPTHEGDSHVIHAPRDRRPTVCPMAIASLQHGLNQQQVEEHLNARGHHQFTGTISKDIIRCISYYRNDVFGHYYLVFMNDRLSKICAPPPFEMRVESYRGQRSNLRTLGDPEDRVSSVIDAEDLIGPNLSAALKPQTPPKRSSDPGLTAAMLLVQVTANSNKQSERIRTYNSLLLKYDPLMITLGEELSSVETRLGEPHLAESLDSVREIRYYGDIEFGLLMNRELMWLAIVYEDQKVFRVYSHDFVDNDKIGQLENTTSNSPNR